MSAKVWTRADVEALGVRTDVPTAGAILAGLCRDEAYRMVKRGKFPVPVLRVGRRLVVPTAPILAALGLDAPDTATGGTSPEAPPALPIADPSPEDRDYGQRTA
jgi:hypothetical protein